MEHVRRKGWNIAVAFAAAWMLVLQLLADAEAAGRHPAALDMFGNPLCISGSAGHSLPRDSGHRDASCCLLGCSVSAAAAPAAPLAFDSVRRAVREAFAPAQPNFRPTSGHRPGNPRAPPLTA